MTTARFTPKSYCAVPAQFGNRRDVVWLYSTKPSTSQFDQLRAAQIQHRVAHAIRSALRELDSSVEDYASALGVTANRMGRMLRGQIVMKLEDVAAAERVLGIEPLANAAVSSPVDESAPEAYRLLAKSAIAIVGR